MAGEGRGRGRWLSGPAAPVGIPTNIRSAAEPAPVLNHVDQEGARRTPPANSDNGIANLSLSVRGPRGRTQPSVSTCLIAFLKFYLYADVCQFGSQPIIPVNHVQPLVGMVK